MDQRNKQPGLRLDQRNKQPAPALTPRTTETLVYSFSLSAVLHAAPETDVFLSIENAHIYSFYCSAEIYFEAHKFM